MGLDFSHCEARWSYSGFNNFRKKLANELGFNLNEMQGFGGSRKFNEIKDDIVYLLDHSDCDGHITAKRCAKVAPRLRELVKTWDNEDYDKIKALELAEGMECAASMGEKLEFR
ncbi:hypothetical protein ACFQZE_06580 [Paenibacillus sp. GCM10027627]|uniref:hypothetical protein n=1 Tax=unclassified Paenibacillus TaxID=185978 RepID=UPI00363CC597